MNILTYNFSEPKLLDTTSWKEVPAVYFVIDASYKPIDVGQTDDLKSRLNSHERMDCWLRSSNGNVYVTALFVEDDLKRLIIEKRIRDSFKFACGTV